MAHRVTALWPELKHLGLGFPQRETGAGGLVQYVRVSARKARAFAKFPEVQVDISTSGPRLLLQQLALSPRPCGCRTTRTGVNRCSGLRWPIWMLKGCGWLRMELDCINPRSTLAHTMVPRTKPLGGHRTTGHSEPFRVCGNLDTGNGRRATRPTTSRCA